MSPTRMAAESVGKLPVFDTTVRDCALAVEATSAAAQAIRTLRITLGVEVPKKLR